MGQHHQEKSEGRQAEEGEGGGGGVGPRHHRLAQHPRQHHRDVLTDEADRRQQKRF